MQTILLVVHVLMGLALIAVILLQQGTGATAGVAFGSGASSTVFGARGSASFLTRMTGILALAFFANSFLLAFLAKDQQIPTSIIEQTLNEAPNPIEQGLAPSDEPVVDIPTDEMPVPPSSSRVNELPDIPNE